MPGRGESAVHRYLRGSAPRAAVVPAAYPWGWTTPSARDFNQPDVASYNPPTGTLRFRETWKPWWAKVRASAGHHGDRYTAAVHARAGRRLVIGHVLPRDATVDSVRLDGRPTPYRLVETARGLEVRVRDGHRPAAPAGCLGRLAAWRTAGGST